MNFEGWQWPIVLVAGLAVFLAADAHSHFYAPLDFSFMGSDAGNWWEANKLWILGAVAVVVYLWWKNNQAPKIISEMLDFEELMKKHFGESKTPMKRQLYANLQYYKLVALQAVDASTPKGSWVARYVATVSFPGYAPDMTLVVKGLRNDIGDRLRYFGSTRNFLIALGVKDFASAVFKLEGAEGPEMLQRLVARAVESGDISADTLTTMQGGVQPLMKGR